MNNPLIYILLTRFKNKLLSIVKKPSQLIVMLLLIFFFGVSIIGGNAGSVTSYVRSTEELMSICLVVFGISFVLTGYSGISKGASLFSMSDVNLLFSSPISPISNLIYGLVQQMSTSLLLGFFILFQYSTIHNIYGMGVDFLIVTFLMYALVSFSGQLTAMVIYILTSHDDKKRSILKYSFIGIFALAVAAIFLKALTLGGDMLESLVIVSNEFAVGLFPVAGWAKMIMSGIFTENNPLYIILGLTLTALYIIVMVVLVKVKQADYYEDVLKATEVSFSAITAKKEGKMVEAVPQNIKVGKIGIGKGAGSDVFYFKHKLESRRAKSFIFDVTTLVYMAVICVFAFIFKNQGLAPIFAMSIYMQMFSVALGRWVKELLMPYVYLIPESPMKKLWNCLKESFVKITAEAVVLFLIIGVIMEMEPLEIFGAVVIRISCGILFTGTNLFCERFFGGINIKSITILLYFLTSMIFAIPALLSVILLYNFTTTIDMWIVYIITGVVNTFSALLALFASRNVLQYAEVNNR